MQNKEITWGHVVLFCIVLLAIITLFKFIFWISLIISLTSTVILLIMLFTSDTEYAPTILIIFAISGVISLLSWAIGYGFEQTEFGKDIIDSAEIIVETDKELNEIQKNVTKEVIKSTSEVISELET